MRRFVVSVLLTAVALSACGSEAPPRSDPPAADMTTSPASPATDDIAAQVVTSPSSNSSTSKPGVEQPATTALRTADPNDPRLDSLAPMNVDEPCPQSDPHIDFGEAMLPESTRLEPVLGQVLAYGQANATEFGTYGLVWISGSDASVFVSFTANLDAHRSALDRLVQHPDELIVCQVALPGDVSAALQARLAIELDGRYVSIGQSEGPIEIGLPAGEDALATELDARYGDAVEVTLGACPLTFDTSASTCTGG